MVNILAFFATILLPGGCILWLLRQENTNETINRRKAPLWLAVPTSFALSISFISLLGWFFYFVKGTFRGVQIAFLLITTALLLASIVKLWRKKPLELGIPFVAVWRKDYLKTWDFYSWLLIVVVFSLALYGGAWFSHTADSLNHIAAVRSLIKYNNPLPMQIYWPDPVGGMDPTFGTWHLVLALFANLTGMDIPAVWLLATVICAPLTVWTLISLARTISNNNLAGFLTGLVYVLIYTSGDFRVAAQPNRMGQILFWLVFVYLLLAIKAFFNQEKKSGIRYIIFSALFAWACSAVHQQYAPALLGLVFPTLVMMALSSVIMRYRGKSDQKVLKFSSIKTIGGVGIVVLPAAAFGLVVRAAYTISDKYPLTNQTFHMNENPDVSAQIFTEINAWFSGYESFVLVTSMLSLFLLLFAIRNRLSGAGIYLVLTSIIIVPLYIGTTTLFVGQGGLVSTMLNRLELLIPPILLIGWSWVIALMLRSLVSNFLYFPSRNLMGIIISIAAIFISLMLITLNVIKPAGGLISIYSPNSTYAFRVDISRNANLFVTRGKAIQALKSLPDEKTILAEARVGYEMAGLTGKTFISYPSQHTPLYEKKINSATYYDVIDFVNGLLDDREMAEILERNEVAYIFIDRERYIETEIWDRLDIMPFLDLDAGDDNWRLYQVAYEKIEPVLTLQEEIDQTGSFFEKLELYNEMSALFSSPERYVRLLARELPVGEDYVADFVAEGRYFTRASRPGSVYSFIQNLDDAERVSDAKNSVYQTTFTVKGDPRGVIFQHPTSELIYTVDIPHNSRLDFSIALDPGTWEFGRGDGVEYRISIEQGDDRRVIFQEYIDPKNVPADRRWLNYSLDLSAYGGKRAKIIFETRPGPQNDNSYDWAGWGEPEIHLDVTENLFADWDSLHITSDDDAEVKLVNLKLDSDKRKLLFQHPTSQVTVNVTLPQNPELRFGMGMLPEVWDSEKSDGMQFKIYLRDTEDQAILYEIFDSYLAPQPGVKQEWQDVVLDLRKFGGKRVEITFETLPGPENNSAFDWGGWSSPIIVERE